jgi:hypothetical protein
MFGLTLTVERLDGRRRRNGGRRGRVLSSGPPLGCCRFQQQAREQQRLEHVMRLGDATKAIEDIGN